MQKDGEKHSHFKPELFVSSCYSSGITIMIITLKFPMVEIAHVDKHTTSHNPKLW